MELVKPAPATSLTAPLPVVKVAPQDAGPPPRARGRTLALWGGMAALAIVAGVVFFLEPWVAKALPVAVETVTPGPLMRVLAVNGRLVAEHEVVVRSRVGGAVLSLGADEGEAVKAGDILLGIDPASQQAVVRQALAALDAGLVAQAEAEATLNRDLALGTSVARVRVEEAERAMQTAIQEVGRLTALFDQARITLGHYTVVAPISGIVLDRGPEVGQIVDVATDLFTLADLAELVVETDVDEAYATQITAGQPAVLQLIGSKETVDGRISFVAPQVDAATGGLAVKIAFDAPVAAPVGMTVTANIIVDQQDSAVSIPRAALVTDATGAAVFVAVANRAVRRAVTVVDWPADRLEVRMGLVAGDIVIIDATGLSDGLTITIPALVGPEM